MEEKTLVVSQKCAIRKILVIIPIVLSICVFIGIFAYSYCDMKFCDVPVEELWNETTMMFEAILCKDSDYGCFSYHRMYNSPAQYAFKCLLKPGNAILLGILGGVDLLCIFILTCLRNCEITVTDKRICGKSLFGKQVDIPMDKAYSVETIGLKGIAVTTTSGRLAFLLIKNQDEIYYHINNLLNERPDNPRLNSAATAYCSIGKFILLSIVTFGIWTYIWVYRTTAFLNLEDSGEYHDPTKKLLLFMFVPFYSIYWFYKQAQRLDVVSKHKNLNLPDQATVCLVLSIFISIVAGVIMQDRINTLCSQGNT